MQSMEVQNRASLLVCPSTEERRRENKDEALARSSLRVQVRSEVHALLEGVQAIGLEDQGRQTRPKLRQEMSDGRPHTRSRQEECVHLNGDAVTGWLSRISCLFTTRNFRIVVS